MAEVITFSDLDKLKCAERELAMRRTVYSKRVRDRKMDPSTAEHEIAVMAAIVSDYKLRLNGSH